MPRSYPPELRRKVLDLVEAGRPIKQVAELLGVSDQTICNRHKQHLIDTGRALGIPSSENAELIAARRRIAQRALCPGSRTPSTRSPRDQHLLTEIRRVQAAGEEVRTGRMPSTEAIEGMRVSVPRLVRTYLN